MSNEKGFCGFCQYPIFVGEELVKYDGKEFHPKCLNIMRKNRFEFEQELTNIFEED
jgi:hypothetical protein